MYSTHVMDMQKIQTKISPWGSDQSSPYKHVWEKNCRAEKKGIPFYTFRINKHFSVKYDQVSGTDVIFLRQGIQLIPVKRVYPPQSWRDILTNLFSWMTYERRDQSCMSCKQQKADYGERVRLFFCYLSMLLAGFLSLQHLLYSVKFCRHIHFGVIARKCQKQKKSIKKVPIRLQNWNFDITCDDQFLLDYQEVGSFFYILGAYT